MGRRDFARVVHRAQLSRSTTDRAVFYNAPANLVREAVPSEPVFSLIHAGKQITASRRATSGGWD
jgi:hypothetical protein